MTSVLALSAVLGFARNAQAQSDQERAGARAAATEGLSAMSQQRWADAVDLFQRAESLVHAPTHLLYLARAYVKLGKLVQGREVYIKITKENLASTAPQPFRDAQTEAGRELGALEPRLAYITIKVQGESKNVAVTSDGERLPSALIGVAQPIDPGKHQIKATAERMESKVAVVELTEGGRQNVTLVLEPAPEAPAPPPVLTMPTAASPTAATAPSGADTGSSAGGGSNGARVGAYAAFGLGAVGLAVGTIFALGAKSDYQKADDICLPRGCPASRMQEVNDLDSSASGKKTLATIGFIFGGVGVGTGTALLLLSGGSKTSASLEPWIGLGTVGARGSF
jgi:hypothetical protein